MKKTEWFPAFVRPVRAGVYEVFRPCRRGTKFFRCFMLWDGRTWRYVSGGYSDFGSSFEAGNKWRGLAKKPE
jgi:hypothetical protein